jgi:hypothetical protein
MRAQSGPASARAGARPHTPTEPPSDRAIAASQRRSPASAKTGPRPVRTGRGNHAMRHVDSPCSGSESTVIISIPIAVVVALISGPRLAVCSTLAATDGLNSRGTPGSAHRATLLFPERPDARLRDAPDGVTVPAAEVQSAGRPAGNDDQHRPAGGTGRELQAFPAALLKTRGVLCGHVPLHRQRDRVRRVVAADGSGRRRHA